MHTIHEKMHTIHEIEFDTASGSTLKEKGGQIYIDFHNNGSLACGHDHEILRACVSYAHPLNIGKYSSAPRAALLETLSKLFPGYGAFQFCSAETLATEGMLRYATALTGKDGFVGFETAYHGNTRTLLSATGDLDASDCARLPGFMSLPYPHAFEGATAETACAEIADKLDAFGVEKLAGMIAEPIHTKMISRPPDGFWKMLVREVLRPRGLLLLGDEAFTSGRVGAWLGFTMEGVQPDIICVGKAMKTGISFGVLAARTEYAAELAHVRGWDSASGQPMDCQNVTLTLQAIKEHQLIRRLVSLERLFYDITEQLNDSPLVRRRCAAGALWGITLKDREVARRVSEQCVKNGVLLAAIRDGLRMTPAFNIDFETAKEGLRGVINSISAVEAEG